MARAKNWRPLKVWHPHEWVPLKNAWQRAEKVIGPDLWLMRRDLRQEFVDGRLIMAGRVFSPDGTEAMRIILQPAGLQVAKINPPSSQTRAQPKPPPE